MNSTLPTKASKILGISFLTIVFITLISNASMFLKKHGRRHALNGLIYFSWMCLGFGLFVTKSSVVSNIVFDTVLGLLGIFLSLSAAYDFGHKNVTNVASGTLDEHATVTHNEMVEHSFYQGINLFQALFLHAVNEHTSMKWRFAFAFAVTSPWLFRSLFPVNRFSDNYNKVDSKSTDFIRLMYRVKKYQYVFYKHFLLHGLNISIVVNGFSLADKADFRLYWMLLNTSYVMEFFLQTLVKKKYIVQHQMLCLQIMLMTASTIAALYVLQYVSIPIAVLSVILNFINRNHDVFNTMLILVLFAVRF